MLLGLRRAGLADHPATSRSRCALARLPAARQPQARRRRSPLRTRLRRPTIVLGSVVTLLGVALTATSFTWREHMTIQRANGKELSGLSSRDYPGARALINHARVPKLPMRPTVLEAKDDIPETTTDGCISDFDDVDVINCTYGDESATRTIALAGGSHAEHWITALDLLGRHAPLQGRHLSEDGLPADHRAEAAGDGRQPALPQVPRVEPEGDADGSSPTIPTTCSPPRRGRGTSRTAT